MILLSPTQRHYTTTFARGTTLHTRASFLSFVTTIAFTVSARLAINASILEGSRRAARFESAGLVPRTYISSPPTVETGVARQLSRQIQFARL
jgi:hypothetical protein